MAIITDVFYGVKCNRCSEIFDDGEHSYWNDENSAVENAMDSEWISENGKHFCPNCYVYNVDNDESIPLIPFPEHVESLRKFIKYMVSGWDKKITEDPEFFIITLRTFESKPLSDSIETYIKNTLGSRLVSIEYPVNKCCTITVKKL